MSRKSKNEQGYDAWAATYDTTINSTVAVDDLAFPPLWRGLRGVRVLEVGPGTGRHTRRLLDQGNTVVGVDLSEGMLALARARFAGLPVRFVHGDLLALPEGEITGGLPFDAAVSGLVLEHIPDLSRFFARLAALLHRGASAYVSEIHPARAKAGRLAHFVDGTSGEEMWLESVAHCAAEVEGAAAKAGFTVARAVDGVGTVALEAIKPGWEKYVGAPMVAMWEFRLEGRVDLR